ncbi:Os07g0422400 [Oryza sativa Japonica Group]|uniref:Os07g0422400 protein n=1 Tax=Oryza sativa subsp. japonica TaxID=39947 RepID=A0A0P0X5P4_ORYSJ|nr:Os07g0422400 [Oryza sativa Japonica Group]
MKPAPPSVDIASAAKAQPRQEHCCERQCLASRTCARHMSHQELRLGMTPPSRTRLRQEPSRSSSAPQRVAIISRGVGAARIHVCWTTSQEPALHAAAVC